MSVFVQTAAAIAIITATLSAETANAQPVPLTLDDVVARVLARNLSVEVAKHRLEAARAERIAARLRPNPSLTVGADNVKVSGPTATGELYEVSTTLSQPIELGDKRDRRREVADLTVAVAEAQVADVLQQRLVEAKRAFYETVLARDTLARAEAIRESYDRLLTTSRTRFDAGDISEGDLIKARLERARADVAVAQASLGLRQTIIRLLDLLGETDFAPNRPVAGELASPAAPPDLTELRAIAGRDRPSVIAAERAADLAARRVVLERSKATPDVSPFLGYRRVGENNTVLFGISIPLPLSDRNQAAIARAIAEEKVAQTEVTQHRQRVLAEVESAWAAWQTARGRVAAVESGLLPQATESLDIAAAAYRDGAIGLLEYLEAQRSLGDVRLEHARSLFEAQASRLMLELAIGRELPR
ncbi:MAG: TolC family protein [Candidatus Rokuibacteriota bacterium]